MDLEKVNAVLNWEAPKSIKNFQNFLGFASFYRRSIYRYLHLCQPLFNLLQKDTPFVWDTACEEVFEALKKTFTSALVLRHFDPELETLVETDTFNYMTSRILCQKHLKNRKVIYYLVAFISEKIMPAKCNYGIGDKKLLNIINALEKWHIYLHQLS